MSARWRSTANVRADVPGCSRGTRLCSGFGCLTIRKQTHLPGGLVHRVGLERLDPGALPNTLVFLFYAGTGAYIEGVNCIAPFGTDISTLAAAQRSTIALPAIQDALRRNAAASVMVLDTGFPEVLRARAPSR